MNSETPLMNQTKLPPEPGFLLGKFGLLAVLGLLVLAAWYRQVVIVVLLGLVLAAAGLSRLWSRLSLAAVRCERTLSETRAFPEEEIELKLRVLNRKLLPLPWVEVEDEIPAGFVAAGSLEPALRPGYGKLCRASSLLWYSGVGWKQTLKCHKRGYYRLGPVTVSSGDIFGLYPRSRETTQTEHIIVYPRIFPLHHLDIPPLDLSGDNRAERRILEDPTRVVGIRDYTPHDSLRHIHWKATARHLSLQVKVFEPTTTLKAAIFLGVDTYNHFSPEDETDFELGISTAASIANFVADKASPVGLFVNTKLADSGQPARLPASSGGGQLVSVLELLAKTTTAPSEPFEDFIKLEMRRLTWGTTLVFIVSRLAAPLSGLLDGLRESGYKLLVFQTGRSHDEANSERGLYTVTDPAGLAEAGF